LGGSKPLSFRRRHCSSELPPLSSRLFVVSFVSVGGGGFWWSLVVVSEGRSGFFLSVVGVFVLFIFCLLLLLWWWVSLLFCCFLFSVCSLWSVCFFCGGFVCSVGGLEKQDVLWFWWMYSGEAQVWVEVSRLHRYRGFPAALLHRQMFGGGDF
jgi:hypothetical protein